MEIQATFRARLGGILSACLALLLALQFAVPHAAMTAAPGAEGLQVVICSDEGLQTITLDLSDGTPQERPVEQPSAKCPFCIVGFAALLDPPPHAAGPAEFHPVRFPLAARGPAHPARLRRSRAIRAPPLTA